MYILKEDDYVELSSFRILGMKLIQMKLSPNHNIKKDSR